MPIDDAALMAAMDKGIADAAPPPAPADTSGGDTSGNDDGDAGDTAGGDVASAVDSAAGSQEGDGSPGDSAGEAGSSVVGEDGAAPDGDAVADGEPATNPDGTPVVAKPADGAKGEGKGDAAGKGSGDVKKPDPLNDPLPNALKAETKERIRTLVSMVKDTSSKFEALDRDHREIMGYIQDTGATAEQYGQALGYLKLVNSPDRADRERALEIMQAEVTALARMLGKTVPGVNFLEGHADLIQEVGSGRITPERAQELAAARERDAFNQREADAARSGREATVARQREVNEGKTALTQLDTNVLRRDPHYAYKRPIVSAQLKPLLKQIHPSQWAAHYKRLWDALPAPAAPARPAPAAATGAVVPKNTPLSGRNPAGGATAAPAPKSLEEAIDFGIAAAR